MPIKGLSEARRLPRLGRIRLGIKKKKQTPDNRCTHKAEDMCFFCSFPVETDYFVCPDEVKKHYGAQPKELDIYLPIDQLEKVFPQRLAWYSAGGRLRCAGDGETALRIFKDVPPAMKKNYESDTEEIDLVDFPCPCPLLDTGDCKRNATLNVVLPKINLGGVYSIVTGSAHSIIEINSNIDYTRALFDGRASMLPLKLRRVERKIQYQDKPARPHWILNIYFDGNIDHRNQIMESRKLMPPVQFALPAPPQVEPGEMFDHEAEITEEAKDGKASETARPEDQKGAPKADQGAESSTEAEIIKDLQTAENPGELDALFKKHVEVVNALSNEQKIRISKAKEEKREELKKNSRPPTSAAKAQAFISQMSAMKTEKELAQFKRDNQPEISKLEISHQIDVTEFCAKRIEEIKAAGKSGRLL